MQEELFDELKAEPKPKGITPLFFPHRFLRVRIAYEDLVCAILGLSLLVLGGFCVGVERGKALTVAPAAVKPSAPEVSRPQTVEVASVSLKSEELTRGKVSAAVASPAAAGSYVIQLASYVTEGPARTEAERLRRQGLNAQVVASGRYFELRVAGYRTRDQAVSTLASLRKTYHDGFVKKVSS
ncbi:MAG: SPOR domain-containing protein [Candidatus Omnitrophica bacterium]|nr:SPOR domain-containing protein [Candidatus Omnitrophota bacterium]